MDYPHVEFTKEMKKDYTILIPTMLPTHFQIIVKIFNLYGYKAELLETTHHAIVDEGLKYVHNDACYPALLVIGQMIDALKSGKYDLNKVALMITQTGGGCRASNYISLLRKALIKNNLQHIPIISLNFSGLEKNSGFKITLPLLIKAALAILYGDMLLWIGNQCKPYEIHKGDTNAKIKWWGDYLSSVSGSKDYLSINHIYKKILDDFASVPMEKTEKPKVGIVGEIYLKYSPLGNNGLEEYLVQEGAEPVVSGLMDFCLYCIYNAFVDKELYGKKSPLSYAAFKIAYRFVLKKQQNIIDCITEHGVFDPPSRFPELVEGVKGYIGLGTKMGEGWLLTGEMLELIHTGVNNIVCAQPFGCLPNHIVAKGMVRKIKNVYPDANIVAVDYDPGATRINQENRLKLMLATARQQMQEKENSVTRETKTPVSEQTEQAV